MVRSEKVSKMKAVILYIFVLFLVYDIIDAKDFHKILSTKMKMAFRKKANFYRPEKNADQAFRDLVEGKFPKRILFYISTCTYVLICSPHIFTNFLLKATHNYSSFLECTCSTNFSLSHFSFFLAYEIMSDSRKIETDDQNGYSSRVANEFDRNFEDLFEQFKLNNFRRYHG